MLDKCGVREVDWVKDLYRQKHAWATAYIRGSFFAGIRTSRYESFHVKLGRYRKTLRRCVRVKICYCDISDSGEVYILQKYRRPERTWEVRWERASDKFICDCMRMESFGLLCVHIVAVLVQMDIASHPDMLVLRRWSKTAKLHYEIVESLADLNYHTITYRTRLGAFT
ncbi:hypothetical protein AHAS_Ahas15G0189900 [Arachis hypogaea]